MNSSPLTPLLDARGARMGARPEHPDSAAVLTFGDVPSEYAASQAGCVLFDQVDRTRITAKGSEAAQFLHRMLANDVRGLGPGSCNRNLLLTSKGKVRFDFSLLVAEDRLELCAAAGMAAPLLAALDMYLFTEDLTLEETSASHAPLFLHGPSSQATASKALGTPIQLELGKTIRTEAGVQVSHLVVDGLAGLLLDQGPEHAAELWAKLEDAGATPAGIVLRDILRVQAGAALFGMDLDENVYPQEGLIEDAFSLEKGCYVGQEVVAKIDTYGGMNKRLCTLRLDDDDPVARGTRLLKEEAGGTRDIGMVTSWAYSFVHDTGMVLAYLKKRNQEPGMEFVFEGRPGRATVVAPSA